MKAIIDMQVNGVLPVIQCAQHIIIMAPYNVHVRGFITYLQLNINTSHTKSFND